ncbi:TRAP-type C4-dicarboxylate transport system substrate-binding protein [Neobacillus niacini]|nr:TRAP-type C4-dicarboxylate transport system substrate-binding protein [Neobacillus niacini]
MTKVDAYMTYNVPVMNRKFYNSLPDDIKKIFDEELNPKFVELMTKSYLNEIEKLDSLFVDSGGKEVITLSKEELDKFKGTVKPIWDQWVEDANERGYPGEEMMNDFIELRKSEGLQTHF